MSYRDWEIAPPVSLERLGNLCREEQEPNLTETYDEVNQLLEMLEQDFTEVHAPKEALTNILAFMEELLLEQLLPTHEQLELL